MTVARYINCRFMDKKLSIKLNAGRGVTGVLRGFDPFMNLVLDEAVEECKDGQRNNIGMVVCIVYFSLDSGLFSSA